MKYDKIVEINKKKSQQNIKVAEREIKEMLKQGELIQVSELVRRTGFSSTFFYNNERVRKLIEQAKDQQKNILKSQNGKIHIPEEIEEKMINLHIEILKLKRKNAALTRIIVELKASRLEKDVSD